MTQLELGTEIPEELYQAIVDIYVYFLKFSPSMEKEEEEKRGDDVGNEQDA